MKIFLDHNEHADWLDDRVSENPDHVFIASYGLYAGISYYGQDTTKWGDKFRLRTRDLMESMRGLKDVRFLIGISDYKSCKGKINCVDCEKQYCRALIRLINHAELFPEFKWKVTNNLHLKAYLFFYSNNKTAKGLGGGRNFSDSDWIDSSFELSNDNIKKLYAYIREIWDESLIIDDDNISTILEEQNISSDGLQLSMIE